MSDWITVPTSSAPQIGGVDVVDELAQWVKNRRADEPTRPTVHHETVEDISTPHRVAETIEAPPVVNNMTWQPGTEGKGFILQSGAVWTWPTENLRPRHMDKAYQVKRLGDAVKPGTAFHLAPDGRVWFFGEGRAFDEGDIANVQAADPRLTMAPPGWGPWLEKPKNEEPQREPAGYGHGQSILDTLNRLSNVVFDACENCGEPHEPGACTVHKGPVQMPEPPAGLKLAARTRAQLLRQRDLFEQQAGPDQSEVVHQFPDGWSINRLRTPHAECYEGELMGNCVGSAKSLLNHVPQDQWHEDQSIGDKADQYYYHSIRDPDNIPHGTFTHSTNPRHHNSFWDLDLEGRAGSNAGKYAPYVHDWWVNQKGGNPASASGWEQEYGVGRAQVGDDAHQQEESDIFQEHRPSGFWNRPETLNTDGLDHLKRAVKPMTKAWERIKGGEDFDTVAAEVEQKLLHHYKPEHVQFMLKDLKDDYEDWKDYQPEAIKPTTRQELPEFYWMYGSYGPKVYEAVKKVQEGYRAMSWNHPAVFKGQLVNTLVQEADLDPTDAEDIAERWVAAHMEARWHGREAPMVKKPVDQDKIDKMKALWGDEVDAAGIARMLPDEFEQDPDWDETKAWKQPPVRRSHVQETCPECGSEPDHTRGSQFVGICGHIWDKLPIEQFKQDLNALPEAPEPKLKPPEPDGGWEAWGGEPNWDYAKRCNACGSPNTGTRVVDPRNSPDPYTQQRAKEHPEQYKAWTQGSCNDCLSTWSVNEDEPHHQQGEDDPVWQEFWHGSSERTARLLSPEEAKGLVVYHGTNVSPEQVQKEGLRPGPSYFGQHEDNELLQKQEEPHGLYFTTSPEEATHYGDDLYKLTVPSYYSMYEVGNDPNYPDSTHFTVPSSIHPDHIERHHYDSYLGLEKAAQVNLDRNTPLPTPGFSPDPKMMYRMIGPQGYQDLQQRGGLYPRQDSKQGYQRAYFNQGAPLQRYHNRTDEDYFVGVPHDPSLFTQDSAGGYPYATQPLTAEHGMQVYRYGPGGQVQPVTARTAKPVDESYWEEETSPEWSGFRDGEPGKWENLYHGTREDALGPILEQGLLPWDSPKRHKPSHTWVEHLKPRPNHVYLTRDRDYAWRIADDAPRTGGKAVIEIDPTHLDPQNINPDEDTADYFGERWDRALGDKGQWAENNNLGSDPYKTKDTLAWDPVHALAHRGAIPPEAIRAVHTYGDNGWTKRPNPAWRPRTAGINENFFTDVMQGGHAPSAVLDHSMPPEWQSEFDKHRGPFDGHIETSIPGYRANSAAKGMALVKAFPRARVLDIASSTGAWGKTLSALSGGGIATDNLDPNPAMVQHFNKTQVPGAISVPHAFGESFTDEGGNQIPRHEAPGQYDVVHESMGFQFISPDRGAQIAEAKNMMRPGGVFLTEQKVITPHWAQSEAVKDAWKRNYYTDDDLARKNQEVGFQEKQSSMMDMLVKQDDLEALLHKSFKFVVQYWSSGNFVGYAASDSNENLQRYVSEFKQGDQPQARDVTPRQAAVPTMQCPKCKSHDVDMFDENPENPSYVCFQCDNVFGPAEGMGEHQDQGCPNCGAAMSITPDRKSIHCTSCGLVSPLGHDHADVAYGPHDVDWESMGNGPFEVAPSTNWGKPKFGKMTIPQQQRAWAKHSPGMDGELTHRFPDGWSAYQHKSPESANAVGKFMRNCWQDPNLAMSHKWRQHHENGFQYHSLHDEHGIPRVAFYTHDNPYTREGPVVRQPLAGHNRPVQGSFLTRLRGWANAKGVGLGQYAGPPETVRGQIGEPQRVGGMTRNQRMRALDEHDQRYGPDTSEVVHTFPDNWTVRRLRTYGDMHREGVLNHNCWRFSDEELQNSPGVEGPLGAETIGPQGLQEPIVDPNAYSLRDPDNHPAVSFYARGDAISEPFGHNNSDIKTEHAQRLKPWAKANGITQVDDNHIDHAWPEGGCPTCGYSRFDNYGDGTLRCQHCDGVRRESASVKAIVCPACEGKGGAVAPHDLGGWITCRECKGSGRRLLTDEGGSIADHMVYPDQDWTGTDLGEPHFGSR